MSQKISQQMRLANGLQVQLIHDPLATSAAALIQVDTGSHDEPEEWPGLAHLLEHLLFTGSSAYQDDERLMAWVQAEGGKLNATTLATSTAYFFEIASHKLEPGFARLVDMLAEPLLAVQAVQQEVAVIDAEYHMLCSYADTLCDAALSQAVIGPHPLQRFCVGHRQSFGDDIPRLQQALRRYYQQFYHAANLRLWLQGPQPLAQLSALAQRYGAQFSCTEQTIDSAANVPLILQSERTLALCCAGAPRLRLSFILPSPPKRLKPALVLLRQLLIDSAEQSLLAILRARGLADDICLLLPYCDDRQAILTIEISVCADDPALCTEIEILFWQWRQQLLSLSRLSRHHYASLAVRAFDYLAPLDQLRAQAFGLAPIEREEESDWQALLQLLHRDNATRLWSSPAVKADAIDAQGFRLQLGPLTFPPRHEASAVPLFRFYPQPQQVDFAVLPTSKIRLPHIVPDVGKGMLLLSPAPGNLLSERSRHLIQACLRTLSGHCAHLGGELVFDVHQGLWLLQLRAENSVMLSSVAQLMSRLSRISDEDRAQGERAFAKAELAARADIAVRRLLQKLPMFLMQQGVMQPDASADSTALLPPAWQAILYGGNAELHHQLSHLLTRFPATINTGSTEYSEAIFVPRRYAMATDGPDSAVLLFCPLGEQSALCLAAWRCLALIFEPHFFQRMRVEKSIGYVVSCRFHQSAGFAGLLFALQSPSCSSAELFAHIEEFIVEMAGVIAAISPKIMAEKLAILRDALQISRRDKPEQAREYWWQQQAYFPAMTEQDITQLDLPLLQHYYRLFCCDALQTSSIHLS